MRVIAGRYRRRVLLSVPGLLVRPTPDRLRETLFNVLVPRIAGAVFVDAYAGTGAVGIEALSRGASRVIFLEKNGPALEVLRKNLAGLGIDREATVVKGDASQELANYDANIVFLDPPYDQKQAYAEALQSAARTETRLVIAQHDSKASLEESYGRLRCFRLLRQGNNSLSFFEPKEQTG